MPRINEEHFIAFPKRMLCAVVAEGATIESVSAALATAGYPDDRVHFAVGEEGLTILNPDAKEGTVKERMLRKAELQSLTADMVIDGAAYLRAGRTLVAIQEIDEDDARSLMDRADEIGLDDCRYVRGS